MLAAFALAPLQSLLYALVYAWLAIGLVDGFAHQQHLAEPDLNDDL